MTNHLQGPDEACKQVSTAHLNRRTRALLDEVDSDERIFIIMRHREPVAILAPFSNEILDSILAHTTEKIAALFAPALFDDELKVNILRLLMDRMPHGNVARELDAPIAEVHVALGSLETSGLVCRVMRGHLITKKGRSVVAALAGLSEST